MHIQGPYLHHALKEWLELYFIDPKAEIKTDSQLVEYVAGRINYNLESRNDMEIDLAQHFAENLEDMVEFNIAEGVADPKTGKVPEELINGERERQLRQEFGEKYKDAELDEKVSEQLFLEKRQYATDVYHNLINTVNHKFIPETEAITQPAIYMGTMLVGIIDTKAGTLTYVDAGHKFGRILGENEFDFYKHPDTQAILGLLPIDYEAKTIPFGKNNTLIAFSDGFIEIGPTGAEMLPVDSYDEFCNSNAPLHMQIYQAAEKGTKIADANKLINNFEQGRPISDDMSMIMIRYI